MNIYGNFVDDVYKEKQLLDLLNESHYISFDEQEVSDIQEDININTGEGGILKPVFIVLLYSDSAFDHIAEKIVKDQTYWHASIGFGPALVRCYSFNFGEAKANRFKGGLSFEDLSFYAAKHPTGTMEVSCILLSTAKYNKLRATLDYYMYNKAKTRYSFINLVYSLFGHKTKNGLKMNLVCSTFVDTILKSINVDVSGQDNSNLVKPDDLRAGHEKEKQFKVFEGKIIDYDPIQVAKMVESMYDNKSYSYFNKKK